MRRTLAIHPYDPSTDFLKVLYEQTPGCTVISSATTETEIRRLIGTHDRIFLLGHGCEAGLIDSTGAFGGCPKMLIGASYASLLAEKKNDVVFIWCMADTFVKTHRLSGFCTGMFVSEVEEATSCGFVATQDQIDASNVLFVTCMTKCINEDDVQLMHKIIKEGPYGDLAKINPVAAYNHARLFVCHS
jgi:hypothetical protein